MTANATTARVGEAADLLDGMLSTVRDIVGTMDSSIASLAEEAALQLREAAHEDTELSVAVVEAINSLEQALTIAEQSTLRRDNWLDPLDGLWKVIVHLHPLAGGFGFELEKPVRPTRWVNRTFRPPALSYRELLQTAAMALDDACGALREFEAPEEIVGALESAGEQALDEPEDDESVKSLLSSVGRALRGALTQLADDEDLSSTDAAQALFTLEKRMRPFLDVLGDAGDAVSNPADHGGRRGGGLDESTLNSIEDCSLLLEQVIERQRSDMGRALPGVTRHTEAASELLLAAMEGDAPLDNITRAAELLDKSLRAAQSTQVLGENALKTAELLWKTLSKLIPLAKAHGTEIERPAWPRTWTQAVPMNASDAIALSVASLTRGLDARGEREGLMDEGLQTALQRLTAATEKRLDTRQAVTQAARLITASLEDGHRAHSEGAAVDTTGLEDAWQALVTLTPVAARFGTTLPLPASPSEWDRYKPIPANTNGAVRSVERELTRARESEDTSGTRSSPGDLADILGDEATVSSEQDATESRGAARRPQTGERPFDGRLELWLTPHEATPKGHNNGYTISLPRQKEETVFGVVQISRKATKNEPSSIALLFTQLTRDQKRYLERLLPAATRAKGALEMCVTQFQNNEANLGRVTDTAESGVVRLQSAICGQANLSKTTYEVAQELENALQLAREIPESAKHLRALDQMWRALSSIYTVAKLHGARYELPPRPKFW